MKIDINEQHRMRTCLLDGNINILTEKMSFFYDETNNIRKFYLEKSDFNKSSNPNKSNDVNFILGGVVHFNSSTNANVSELKRLVKLQESAEELKFKHLVPKRSEFRDCLKNNKIRAFLQWLDDTDLYIHYFNINHLYYAIVDIIDSIQDERMPYNYELAIGMKNELYIFAIKHYDEFFTLLKEFKYPNVDDSEVSVFCEKMINLISNEYSRNIYLECLIQSLKSARNKKELIFLKGNEESTIIDNYYSFYLENIFMFKNSTHIFDKEVRVEKEIDNIELYDGDKLTKSYKFVNSKESELVQVSDCIVGLIRRYYNYINKISLEKIDSLNEELTNYEKDTLNLFCKLILKSENKCIYYLHSINSIYDQKKNAKMLNRKY